MRPRIFRGNATPQKTEVENPPQLPPWSGAAVDNRLAPARPRYGSLKAVASVRFATLALAFDNRGFLRPHPRNRSFTARYGWPALRLALHSYLSDSFVARR